jgi:DNA invertase Pin-like site-specific DNA recombinase
MPVAKKLSACREELARSLEEIWRNRKGAVIVERKDRI